MNTQPLDLLTTSQMGDNAGGGGAGNGSGASNGPARSQHHLMSDSDRQLALASIFSSLTSLAGHNQHQPAGNQSLPQAHHLQFNHHIQHHLQQQSKTILENQIKPGINHQQRRPAEGAQVSSAAVASAAVSNNLALSNSIQSVMAAAMMQQQMSAVANQQINQDSVMSNEQQQHQQQQQAPANMFVSEQQPPELIDCSQSQNLSLHQQQALVVPQMQPQRINYCTICNKELCNKYFMKTHMLKMHGINLEMERPDSADGGQEQLGEDGQAAEGNGGDNAEEGEHDQIGSSECSSSSKKSSGAKKLKSGNTSAAVAAAAAANSSSLKSKQATSVLNGFAGNSMGGVVCDICNKELCSKYFLKVHKQNTHGIMTDYQDAASQFSMYNPFAAGPVVAGQLYPPTLAPNLSAAQAANFPANPLSLFGAAAASAPTTASECPGQQSQPRLASETLPAKSKSSAIKRSRSGQPSNSKNQAPAHSIPPNNANIEKTGGEPMAPGQGNQFESIYRLILAQQQQQQQPLASNQASLAQPQHQQRHQRAAAVGTTSVAPQMQLQLQAPPTLMPIDPSAGLAMTANPLGALMCFGAMGHPSGPFGPAAMSPAMIVDNILRNQHLFARNGAGAAAAAATPNASIPKTSAGKAGGANSSPSDKSNKNNSGSKQTTGKGSKDSANNSRYFNHYTEACPMCDRRFKSIKWLKTHMMNDHKQEIGAYMQMMMQYLYATKTSQQMAAAATLAAIEQQQQQQQQFHHHQQQQQQHLQPPPPPIKSNQNHRNPAMMLQQQQQQPTSLLSNCFNLKPPLFGHPNNYQYQSNHQNAQLNQNKNQQNYEQAQQPQQFNLGQQYQNRQEVGLNLSPTINNPEPAHHLSLGADFRECEMSGDFVVDARCNRESYSPANSLIHQQQSPNSPRHNSQMNLNGTNDPVNYLMFGLNFELSKLANNNRAADEFSSRLQSRGSPLLAGSDIGIDDNTTSGDSDRLTARGYGDNDDGDDQDDLEDREDRDDGDVSSAMREGAPESREGAKLGRTGSHLEETTNGNQQQQQQQMCMKATKSAAS